MATSLEKETTPHQHFADDDTSDEDPGWIPAANDSKVAGEM